MMLRDDIVDHANKFWVVGVGPSMESQRDGLGG